MKCAFPRVTVMTLLAAAMICLLTLTTYAQFQNLYGLNASNTDEYFHRVIPYSQGFYLLGVENNVAYISHTDLNGDWEWTSRLNIPSLLTDARVLPGTNDLLFIGLTLSGGSNQSILGQIDRFGNIGCLNILESPGLEALIRMDVNPNGSFTVVGFQTDLITLQDVVIMDISPNCVINSKRIFISSVFDDFANDIEVLGTDFYVAGIVGNTATIYRTSLTGTFVGGVQNPVQYTYTDIEEASGDLLAIANPTGAGQPRIMRFDSDLLALWEISIFGVSRLEHIVENNGDIYVVGTATVAGMSRSVIFRIDDSSGPQIVWAKYIDDSETSFAGGSLALLPNSDIAYVDAREHSSGFGDYDAFFTLTDEDLTTTCTQEITLDFSTEFTLFDSPVEIALEFYDVPPFMGSDAVSLDWVQVPICDSIVTMDTCICPMQPHFMTLTHSGIDYAVGCLPHGFQTPVLECPPGDIVISGFWGCIDPLTGEPCTTETEVVWDLAGPNGYITGGSTTYFPSILIPAADVSTDGTYFLTLSTLCAGATDSCFCVLDWIVECDPCCMDSLAFIAAAQNVQTFGTLGNCEISFAADGLTECMQITYYWNDPSGAFTGPITNNNVPVSFTYPGSGTYSPCYVIEEVSNDSICWEYVHCDTIDVFCDSCCLDYDLFCQNVMNGVSVSVNDSICKATININNLPVCDSIFNISWGDLSFDAGPYGNGDMPMHTYASNGTYLISYVAIETNPLTGLICFEKVINDTIVLLCDPCDSVDQTLTVGLTGYFPFNGNANDLSNSGINGIVTGATLTTGHDNVINSAYHFNGNNDQIIAGTNNRNISDQVSIAAWIRTSELINGQWVAGKYSFLEDRGYHLTIGDNASAFIGKVAFSGRDGTSTYHTSGYSPTLVNDNEWHCVVGTAGHSEWKVYVDGALESSATGSTFPFATSSNQQFTIGWHTDPNFPLSMNGDIDNVLVFNRVLSADEIKCFCADVLPAICACPVGTVPGPELVINGNFESGNTGFTSAYNALVTTCSPAEYTVTDALNVGSLCNNWSCNDHTTGLPLSLFFVADGSQVPGQAAWRTPASTPILIDPATDYSFCAWVNNLNQTTFDRADPIVEAYIDDGISPPVLLVSTGALPESPDVWINISTVWSSPSTISPGTPYWLEFRTASTSFEGNNFALDDISFRKCSESIPDSCCADYDLFCQNVMNAVSIVVDNTLCKATLNIGNLPPCDSIAWVNWGQGPVQNGPFTTGDMPMHTYTGSSTYYISYLAIEYDYSVMPPRICFEKLLSDTITLDCVSLSDSCDTYCTSGNRVWDVISNDHFIQDMIVFQGNLIVAGSFNISGMNNIGAWNGANWSTLGNGTDGTVYALAEYNGNLYAGGQFTMAGSTAANSIAVWDGTSWSPVGSGIGGSVMSLQTFSAGLAVGGSFSTAGIVAVNNIALWNGSWSALGNGITGTVHGLGLYNGELVAGGVFSSPANNIAYWDGSTWNSFGGGINLFSGNTHQGAKAILQVGNDLIVGGRFSDASFVPGTAFIASWNGGWSSMGGGVNTSFEGIYDLRLFGGELYAGGLYSQIGGNSISGVARWDGSAWNSTSHGDRLVLALESYMSPGDYCELYAGGEVFLHKWDCVSTTDDAHKQSIRVFPNPNTGEFTVDLSELTVVGTSLRITGLHGQLLTEQNFENSNPLQNVDARMLPEGMYIIQIISEGRVTAVSKFVKM